MPTRSADRILNVGAPFFVLRTHEHFSKISSVCKKVLTTPAPEAPVTSSNSGITFSPHNLRFYRHVTRAISSVGKESEHHQRPASFSTTATEEFEL